MDDIELSGISETALRLAKTKEGLPKRSFLSSISWGEPRIKVLRGFRGAGKTTAMLQLLDAQSAYFSMDSPQVSAHTLYDLGKAFVLRGAKRLLVDEVHYYKEWKRDVKALYDEFPGLSLVVSGSAPLVFEPERRFSIIEVDPLSFGEFLKLRGDPAPSSEAWLDRDASIALLAGNPSLYEAYEKYQNGGAFPSFFSYKEETIQSIYGSIRKSIREDAVFAARVDGEIIASMEKSLVLLATSPLGEYNVNSFARNLNLKNYKAEVVVDTLEKMRILRLVRPHALGGPLVRQHPKLMFYHPVMRTAMCSALKSAPDKGAIREEMAAFFFSGRGWKVSTIKGAKRSPDYIVEKGKESIFVEIGGPSKRGSQLADFKGRTLLMDDRQLISLGLF